jgi:CRP-like cAMP-binding protein
MRCRMGGWEQLMASPASDHVLIRKLNALGGLSPAEEEALLRIVGPRRTVNAGVDIVEDGASPGFSTVLLQGFACRYKLLREGRRQILAFQIPGDIVDLYSYVVPKMDHAVAALTRCVVAPMAHTEIRSALERFPNLAHLLWRDSLIDGSIVRTWLIGLGRRPAASRLAHLLCELHHRLKAVGLVDEASFQLPVTQGDIADAVGLSAVHVNRTLKKLRTQQLISVVGQSVTIINGEGLGAAAGFDPTYLHFRPEDTD